MVDDLESLKRKVDSLRTKKEQAQGAYDQLLKRIKEEFLCRTLQEAEAKLMELQQQEREAARVYTKAKESFQKRHEKTLSSVQED